MSDKTQSLLPVTIPNEIWRKVDELSRYTSQPNTTMEWAQYTDRLRCALAETLLELQSHSLPGDVGIALPRLDDGLIEAALIAHYGKGTAGINGLDLTANDVNWTFRDGFKRMWAGVRKELKRRAALTPSALSGEEQARKIAREVCERRDLKRANGLVYGAALEAAKAALGLSALSGDAGEGEKVAAWLEQYPTPLNDLDMAMRIREICAAIRSGEHLK